MDSKLAWETVSLVLLLAAFPVISLGATHHNAPLWWVGLAAVIVGALVPVATRFMDHSADQPTDMGIEYDERTS